MAEVKKIAMIYREVGTCGGIQRGASFQIGQFREWGYDPVVLTEADLGTDGERAMRLEKALREHRADLVIEHDAYDEAKLSADIAAAHRVHVPIVVFWHSVFSWMFASGNRKASDFAPLLRQCDAVIALSKTDETYFRMIGCRSLAIHYRDADLMQDFNRTVHPHRVVWMGRFVALKRPLDAIRIVERLRENVPDVELVVLGDGNPEDRAELECYLRDHPALRPAVRLEGYQKDVRPYLEKAGAGLVTSKFEGYCHAIVEMKMASIPVVSYAMPYLETLDKGTGAFQVPQGDVESAAAALAKLFQDPEECRRQGLAARASFEDLCAFDERGAYERLFSDLARPWAESTLTAVSPEMSVRVLDVLTDHAVTGFSAVSARVRRKTVERERGVPGFRGKIARLLFRIGRRLCGWR